LKLWDWWMQNAWAIGATWKVWAETIAYGSGGVFLIYKMLSGYFITDVALRPSCRRKCTTTGFDYLSVTAILKKGERGTIVLHDAQVRITDAATGSVLDQQAMMGIDRLSFTTDRAGRSRINFGSQSKTSCLNLPPGDETQFTALCKVPSEVTCILEIVVLGRTMFGRHNGQWRASDVSFPGVA
jgi:hypothetical protein